MAEPFEIAIAVSGRMASGVAFVAGVIARGGRVIEVAPILRRHVKPGLTGEQLVEICKRRGWKWERAAAPK
jgi:dephospho-CoA kinase